MAVPARFQLGLLLALSFLTTLLMEVLSTSQPCACPKILQPVCGADGRTYDNDCLATKCGKTTIAYSGQCRDGASTQQSAPAKLCPCPRILSPVCGTNGERYDNECLAACAGTKLAPCPEDTVTATSTPKPVNETADSSASPGSGACACPANLDPVCGNDGKTYDNDCLFTRCRTPDFKVKIAYKGACKPATAQAAKPCACPLNLDPVCGTDGKTYDNDCLFTRCRTPDFKVKIAHKGACKPATAQAAKPCACPLNLDPVCGTDGKTYDNDCLFTRCRTPDFKVKIAYKGPCTAMASAATTQPAVCGCPRIYDPVCGSDGKTYDNDCLFTRCRTPDFKVKIAYKGPCKPATAQAAKPCACPLNLDPVCGTDGKTYDNDCLFTRCRTPDFKVKIAYKGPCTATAAAATTQPAVCGCPRIYAPVCGSDGKTYDNDCLFTRCRTPDFKVTIVSEGPCKA